jgi:WD40 repeat protein
LLARIGEGGMGTVYLASDPQGRCVAIKVIRPELAHDPEFRDRFRSEVDRARQVPPFCTAEVIDADPEHATPYLVVDYVDGPSLDEVVREKGPLTTGDLHSVAVGVATALAAIHGAGVVHRDLKPANVLFGLGTPKVIDFGIARALDATSGPTRTDHMVGTIGYMAPERFDTRPGRQAGPAADVFAWGVVVAYAATGSTPFAADTPMATIGRILTQPPNLTGLSGYLLDLVTAALSKEPANRPTAPQLLDSLLTARGDVSGELDQRPELRKAAMAARHTGRVAIRRRRGRRVLVAGMVLALATSAVGAVAHFDGIARRDAAAAQRQKSTVQRQANLLAAQTLLAESGKVRDADPGLALRTAMAAQKINPGASARAAVTAALNTHFAGEIGTTGPTARASYRPDGKAVVTAGIGSLDLWSVSANGAFTHAASMQAGKELIDDVAFSPDGTTLASIASDVRLWDVRRIDAPRLLGVHKNGKEVYQGVSFTRDGTGLLVINGDTISMWRLKDRRVAETLWTMGPFHDAGRTLIDSRSGILVRSGNVGDVQVWRLRGSAKPSPLATLRRIGYDLSAMAVRPDGKLMALAGEGRAELYDLADPAQPRHVGTLKPSTGRTITAITFNRSGNLIATGGVDKTVTVWDVRAPSRPARLVTMRGHGGEVTSAEFSPNGARLLTASSSFDHTTMQWQVDTPLQARLVATLPKRSKTYGDGVGFADADTLLVHPFNGGVTSWKVSDPAHLRKTGTPLAITGGFGPSKVRTGGPGNHMVLVVGGIWDVSGSRAQRVLPAPTNNGRVPDGVAVLDMDPGAQLAAVTQPEPPSPSQAGEVRTKVLIYRVPGAGKPVLVSSLPATDISEVTFAESGHVLLVGVLPPSGERAAVEVWDLRDPEKPRRTAHLPVDDPFNLAIDPSGAKIASGRGPTIQVWDTEHGGNPLRVPTGLDESVDEGAGVTGLALSHDGALLAIGTVAGTELWSIASDAPPVLLQTIHHNSKVDFSRVAFSVGRPILAIADAHETTLWDTTTLMNTIKEPMAQACRISTGPSREEWQHYAAGVPYLPVCT